MLSAGKKAEDILFYEGTKGKKKCHQWKRCVTSEKPPKATRKKCSIDSYRSINSADTDVDLSSQSSSTALTPGLSVEYEQSEEAGPSSKSTFVTLNVPRNLINSTEITEVLDSLKMSDNAATMLVAPLIIACQGDVEDFCFSRSSTYRDRIANRLQISNKIFKQITEVPTGFPALHWVGKLTEDRFGNKHEALSVLVSGMSNYKEGKLLGVQNYKAEVENLKQRQVMIYWRCGI